MVTTVDFDTFCGCRLKSTMAPKELRDISIMYNCKPEYVDVQITQYAIH